MKNNIKLLEHVPMSNSSELQEFTVDRTKALSKYLNTVLDRQVWANSVDPDILLLLQKEQSDQGLLCLPFCLHRFDGLLYGKATLFKF